MWCCYFSIIFILQLPGGPDRSFFENWKPTLEKRRSTITPKPHTKLNLWSIMKNCIGRDLSRIPMPVRREGGKEGGREGGREEEGREEGGRSKKEKRREREEGG